MIPSLIGCHCFENCSILFGLPPSPGPASELFVEDGLIPPRPLPILESSPPSTSGSLPSIIPTNPSPCTQATLPASSPELGISPPLVSDIPLPR